MSDNLRKNVLYSTESSLRINGLRENDLMNIDLFQGKPTTIFFNRTKYLIRNKSEKFEMDYIKSIIDIPVFNGDIEIEIRLEQFVDMSDKKCFGRYLVKSLNGRPFKLNGTFSLQAFIERGDILELGFNKIKFSKKAEGKNDGPRNDLSDLVVKSKINILIEGETGTGKSTLAKNIHNRSERFGNFVHLNLSSFSPNLVESELFGHVKGAYTGANSHKRGAILEANKGTLFLDEIDSLSIELQTKLLLFLDNHEVRHVGGESQIKSDVRLIFASGSKLSSLVEEQKMRKDFYFRINSGIKVELKNLRSDKKRIEEICKTYCNENFLLIDQNLIKYYQSCLWPGNIRQILAHLEKKKMICAGKKLYHDNIDDELMMDEIKDYKVFENKFKTLEEVKLDYCSKIFYTTNKNLKKSAEILDVSPNTMKSMVQKMIA